MTANKNKMDNQNDVNGNTPHTKQDLKSDNDLSFPKWVKQLNQNIAEHCRTRKDALEYMNLMDMNQVIFRDNFYGSKIKAGFAPDVAFNIKDTADLIYGFWVPFKVHTVIIRLTWKNNPADICIEKIWKKCNPIINTNGYYMFENPIPVKHILKAGQNLEFELEFNNVCPSKIPVVLLSSVLNDFSKKEMNEKVKLSSPIDIFGGLKLRYHRIYGQNNYFLYSQYMTEYFNVQYYNYLKLNNEDKRNPNWNSITTLRKQVANSGVIEMLKKNIEIKKEYTDDDIKKLLMISGLFIEFLSPTQSKGFTKNLVKNINELDNMNVIKEK